MCRIVSVNVAQALSIVTRLKDGMAALAQEDNAWQMPVILGIASIMELAWMAVIIPKCAGLAELVRTVIRRRRISRVPMDSACFLDVAPAFAFIRERPVATQRNTAVRRVPIVKRRTMLQTGHARRVGHARSRPVPSGITFREVTVWRIQRHPADRPL